MTENIFATHRTEELVSLVDDEGHEGVGQVDALGVEEAEALEAMQAGHSPLHLLTAGGAVVGL